ncbi:hypothetical protein [Nonomuraea sp. 10N515B]|uniref:hypothetical protein n=1 Tax=Nonomuraea sp. 10N515B TaxID=3457422 RepID=UPI003FCC849A
MTTPGRYSGKPKQPADVTQVRIIGPAHVVDQVREVLALAADTMPGWRIANTSRPLPAHAGRIRRYVDVEVREPAPTPSGRYRYPCGDAEVRDA